MSGLRKKCKRLLRHGYEKAYDALLKGLDHLPYPESYTNSTELSEFSKNVFEHVTNIIESDAKWEDLEEDRKNEFVGSLRDYFYQEELLEDSSEEILSLKPVEDFFSKVIGAMIIDFEAIDENIAEFDEKLANKRIVSVSVANNKVILHLQDYFTNKEVGQLVIGPTSSGIFTMKIREDEEVWASRYRIGIYRTDFLHSTVIEYIDSNTNYSIDYKEI